MDNNTSLLPFKISILSVPKTKRYYKGGNWSQNEKLKFAFFMDHNRHLFQEGLNKKSIKIFLVMSRFIKIRNSAQCRSHHQKALRRYGTTQKIIKSIKSRFGQEKYKKLYQIYKLQLQQINRSSYDVTYQESCLRKKNDQNMIIDFTQSHILNENTEKSNQISKNHLKIQFMEEQANDQFQKEVACKIQRLEKINGQKIFSTFPQPYIDEQFARFYGSQSSHCTESSLQNYNWRLQQRKLRVLNQCHYHLYCWMGATMQLQNIKEQQKSWFFN